MTQPPPRFPPDPDRRDALRAQLLARHQQRYPAPAARAHRWVPRLVTASVLVLVLSFSFAAPAEHEVEVGRRITLTLSGDGPPPDPRLLLPLITQLGATREIQVRLERRSEGPATLRLDLWGGHLAADAAERLRAGVPGLENASITDEPLRGHARTRLGLLLGQRLLGLSDDPASIAAAKAALQAELAERGEQGQVDIQLEKGEDGERKVKVTVERTRTELREESDAGAGD
jgi:hypothetical protein